ncbi:hypothetical protein TU84_14920 [Pseudomonas helleri]|nr:hypothetical protein TU84_14920 [Pseudomonas helleri]
MIWLVIWFLILIYPPLREAEWRFRAVGLPAWICTHIKSPPHPSPLPKEREPIGGMLKIFDGLFAAR